MRIAGGVRVRVIAWCLGVTLLRLLLHPLPVGDLWGVGERTAELLERLGLRTIGDVAAVPAATLQRALGTMGAHLAKLAVGDDSRPVVADQVLPWLSKWENGPGQSAGKAA